MRARRFYDTMFPINEMTYHSRGGKEEHLAARQKVANQGRADTRLAVDANGELYIYSKSDGMIRQVVEAPPSSMRLTLPALVLAAWAAALAAPPTASETLTLELRDFAALPITVRGRRGTGRWPARSGQLHS